MADDSPPISTEVPETVTIDTGADSKQLGDLNAEFKDFWAEQDAAPAAPGEGAAQETKETKVEPPTKEPEPVSKAPEPVTKPAESPSKPEFTDDDIDRMQLGPHVRPEAIQEFKNVREMWKADRALRKAEQERATKLQAELEEARKNAWTPETKADYEHAVSIRRKFDFTNDPEFIQKFHVPVQSKFEQVLNEAIAALPDKAAATAWAQDIYQKYKPDQLSREWWLHSVVDKVPDELDRAALLGSVTELIKTQRERDTEIQRRTQDKSAYENYQQERNQQTAQRVQEEIMAEIGEQEKRIQEVMPRDPESAKTTEERAAIEVHNERFKRLNERFTETMKDISGKGPRGWVRAAVEATRAMLLEGEYKKLEEENKSLKAERDQFRAELDKIAGVRRRISHTAPPPSAAKKNGEGLSIKNLDVRKAFDDFDWGDR